jgi:hypothetical protein
MGISVTKFNGILILYSFRTGKRTYIGAMNDLFNSIIRYVKNNYMDGSRQDGIDLILGKYKVIPALSSRDQFISPFQTQTLPLYVKFIPIYLLLSLILFNLVLFSPNAFGINSSLVHVTLLSFLFAAILASWSYILQNGTEFVDWPKLIPLSLPRVEDRPLEVTNTQDYVFTKYAPRRSSTVVLNEIEQGYELPILKKTT